MKIIFFNHFISGGGAERFTSLISRQLVENGYEVKLVTDIYYPFSYDFDRRIEILPLFDRANQRLNKFSLFRMILNSRKIIRKERADVLVGVLPLMSLTVYLASVGLDQHLIASDHTSIDRPVSWFVKCIKRFVYPRFSAVTLLTETDANIIGDKLPNKIVMPNPLSFKYICDFSKPRRSNILAVGRLDYWKIKGFDLLIEAWGGIAYKYPNWGLEIAGAGNEESIERLNMLADKNHISGQFKLLGFRKDIDTIMRESSIFVLSSRIEGFGMVLIEAMSQGCACISFNDGGRQREIIRNNNEGLIVENHDVKELSSKIELLISNVQLRNNISACAVKRSGDYALPIIVEKWENLFSGL